MVEPLQDISTHQYPPVTLFLGDGPFCLSFEVLSPLMPVASVFGRHNWCVRAAGEVVKADLVAARRCIALARERLEDTTIGVKYLTNIARHPQELKYRTLKMSNR